MPDPLPALSDLRHHLLGVYDRVVEPRFLSRPPFADSAYTTWLIRSGSVRVHAGSEDLHAGRAQWVFFDPFIPRAFTFTPGTHLLSVRFQIFRGQASALEPPAGPWILPRDTALPGLEDSGMALARSHTRTDNADNLGELCRREAAFYGWLACWHPAHSVLPRSSAHRHGVDPRIHQIISLLARSPGLGVIDYPALQQAVKLSRSQIDRIFHQHLGLSPRQWAERHSLSLAQQWLASGNDSVKEIAARLRFTDASHFAKWFRRLTGLRPSEARRPH